jgi:hypothetical protein
MPLLTTPTQITDNHKTAAAEAIVRGAVVIDAET